MYERGKVTSGFESRLENVFNSDTLLTDYTISNSTLSAILRATLIQISHMRYHCYIEHIILADNPHCWFIFIDNYS